MHFKLLVAFVDTEKTHTVIDVARGAGATGATVIGQARGEGIEKAKSFFGMVVDSHRDLILFLVEEHLSRDILEAISKIAHFEESGGGMAIQIDVEDAVGIAPQIRELTRVIEEEI